MPNAYLMKITNGANCGCGKWEYYSESKAWTLESENAVGAVSVQFMDYEGSVSACKAATILHDNQAPMISIAANPKNTYVSDSSSSFDYSIIDTGIGVGGFECLVNGAVVNCSINSSGSGSLTLPAQQTGSYTLEIVGSDKLGNTSRQTLSWIVRDGFSDISQNFEVHATGGRVDILFIIDNSGSMQYEQKSMAKRMSTFMKQIEGMDYQIGITTTDTRDRNIGDGRLVEMKGLKNTYVIDSSMPIADAQRILGDTLQRKEVGDSREQGIFNTYRAIERHLDGKSKENMPHKKLFRSDASLAVVVITDEDESGSSSKNKPENLVKFVKQTWPNKNFAFHSIITIPNDKKCKSGEGASYGYAYFQLSKLTGFGTTGGAIVGSVCEKDYGSQLAGLGRNVSTMTRMVQLDCAPTGNVSVKQNGVNFTAPFTIEGSKVIFVDELPAGSYVLNYRCKK